VRQHWLITFTFAFSGLLASCSQQKIGEFINGKRHAPEIVDVVEGRDGDQNFMKIYIDLDDTGFALRIYNLPSASEVFCEIDDRDPSPCRHGDRFDRPSSGEHRITVTARNNGRIVDSAIAKFTIVPGSNENQTIGSGDTAHPLALIVSNLDFTNGDPVPVSRDFTVKFSFPQVPPCENPVLRCAMDSVASIWSLCDTKERRRVIPAYLMANGSQSLFAQASCGDLTGPVLRVQWYGVPDNYQPLMPQIERDESNGRLVSLAREPDCPANAVIWECRMRGTPTSWESCASGGRIDAPTANLYDALRAICGSQRGPAISL
jgi:hypothetical protein